MPRQILAFGAHPDDVEIGCGGTLAKLVAAGDRLDIALMTSGEAGHQHTPAAELAAIREREADAGARVLGAERIHFLRFTDGLTGYERCQKVTIIDLIRSVKPDIVFVHGAQDHFPDHRVVHELVMGAITGAAGPWYQECQKPPHNVGSIYGFEVWHPLNRWQLSVDVTGTMERKREALRCHKSQIQDVDYLSAVDALARYRGALGCTGHHAEVFEAIRIRDIV